MEGFYKLVVKATHFAQAINNVLYYGDDVGDTFPAWSPAIAADLADTFGETVLADWLTPLPTEYLLSELVVSFVDARGVTDPTTYEVSAPQASSGGNIAPSAGSYNVGIIAFRTNVGNGAALPLKRSYIAFGPLTREAAQEDGTLTATTVGQLQTVADLLGETLIGVNQDFRPVRLGRTEAPAPIRYGDVIDTFVRPQQSTRRSRKPRPTGT